nr:hypothetical protein TorRG33x02_309020 [Ipomoea batatas]
MIVAGNNLTADRRRSGDMEKRRALGVNVAGVLKQLGIRQIVSGDGRATLHRSQMMRLKGRLALLPRNLSAASSYALAAASAVSNVPNQTLAAFCGSLISAAHFPHGLCLTPLYLLLLSPFPSSCTAAATAVVTVLEVATAIIGGVMKFRFPSDSSSAVPTPHASAPSPLPTSPSSDQIPKISAAAAPPPTKHNRFPSLTAAAASFLQKIL